jgi:hypothetical protein
MRVVKGTGALVISLVVTSVVTLVISLVVTSASVLTCPPGGAGEGEAQLLSFCRGSFLIEKCGADPSPNCYRFKKLKET